MPVSMPTPAIFRWTSNSAAAGPMPGKLRVDVAEL